MFLQLMPPEVGISNIIIVELAFCIFNVLEPWENYWLFSITMSLRQVIKINSVLTASSPVVGYLWCLYGIFLKFFSFFTTPLVMMGIIILPYFVA
jgi:hypothetical protein